LQDFPAEMKVIGITGGIGMGKSTAGDLLYQRGFPVVDTDKIARDIVEPGQPALTEIKAAFGEGVIGPDDRLSRGKLAQIVFADPALRQKLEQILHPRIREVWQADVNRWRRENYQFGFVLIPLLFETDAARSFDAVICVTCSEATQLARLQARGWSIDEIQRRKAAQWPVQKKMDAATYVIWTDTTLSVHSAQLDRTLASF
jgi:dephospho-CoA kinase